jgi:hypothetical protein
MVEWSRWEALQSKEDVHFSWNCLLLRIRKRTGDWGQIFTDNLPFLQPLATACHHLWVRSKFKAGVTELSRDAVPHARRSLEFQVDEMSTSRTHWTLDKAENEAKLQGLLGAPLQWAISTVL